MKYSDFLGPILPALPVLVVAAFILYHASQRWKGRFERGNGRPAAPCRVCGQMYQRGLPMQQHFDNQHAPKKGKR